MSCHSLLFAVYELWLWKDLFDERDVTTKCFSQLWRSARMVWDIFT